MDKNGGNLHNRHASMAAASSQRFPDSVQVNKLQPVKIMQTPEGLQPGVDRRAAGSRSSLNQAASNMLNMSAEVSP